MVDCNCLRVTYTMAPRLVSSVAKERVLTDHDDKQLATCYRYLALVSPPSALRTYRQSTYYMWTM